MRKTESTQAFHTKCNTSIKYIHEYSYLHIHKKYKHIDDFHS